MDGRWCGRLLAAAAAFGVMANSQAAPAAMPASAAFSAYGVGQSYVRLFQDSVMPGVCGIVLERERCNADFQTVRAWRGSDPSDEWLAKWLADGDIALHTNEWNGSYIPDKGWVDEPAFSWWYTAGVVSIATDQPRNDATSEYLAHYVDELSRHAGVAPDGFAGLVLSSGSPFERAQPLQRALQAANPPAPYPLPSFAPGDTATAQLGAYHATLQELVDNPLALSRPESRKFAAVVLAELARRHGEYRDGLSVASVQAEVNADIPNNPPQLNTSWREPLTTQAANMKWPDAPRKAFLLGELLAQVAYNAAVLKDPAADASFRGAISQLPPWREMTASVRSDISALQKVPATATGGSWQQINATATRATLDLIASS